jgi:hypothetical protein
MPNRGGDKKKFWPKNAAEPVRRRLVFAAWHASITSELEAGPLLDIVPSVRYIKVTLRESHSLNVVADNLTQLFSSATYLEQQHKCVA